MKKSVFILLGILYALSWASASTAAKIGLKYAQPLVLYQTRYFFAALSLIVLSLIFSDFKFPTSKEWKQLFIFGFFGGTVYFGLFVYGINKVAAGLGPLFVALNPILMVLFSGIINGTKIRFKDIFSLFLGIGGVTFAVFPFLGKSHFQVDGILILSCCMLVYSLSSIYFGRCKWQMDLLSVSAWQTLIAAMLLLPFTLFFYEEKNTFNQSFWFSAIWMGIMVSGLAVTLWLFLLQENSKNAAFFPFLCPIAGFFYASIFLNEPFTWYSFTGLVLVIFALALSQINKKEAKSPLL